MPLQWSRNIWIVSLYEYCAHVSVCVCVPFCLLYDKSQTHTDKTPQPGWFILCRNSRRVNLQNCAIASQIISIFIMHTLIYIHSVPFWIRWLGCTFTSSLCDSVKSVISIFITVCIKKKTNFSRKNGNCRWNDDV